MFYKHLKDDIHLAIFAMVWLLMSEGTHSKNYFAFEAHLKGFIITISNLFILRQI